MSGRHLLGEPQGETTMRIETVTTRCPVCRGRCRKFANPGERGYCSNCQSTGEIAAFSVQFGASRDTKGWETKIGNAGDDPEA